MNENFNQYDASAAWLEVMNISGIGSKRGWAIYRFLQEHGLQITDLFDEEAERWQIPGVPDPLLQKLLDANHGFDSRRIQQLESKGYELLYPGSHTAELPIEESLPPTLVYWGNTDLLHGSQLVTLLFSKDADDDLLRRFLIDCNAADETAVWCFCPFSKRDWVLVEGLLRAGDNVLLGSVSGIPKRALMLKKEFPTREIGMFALEPQPKNRRSQLSYLEGCYRLLLRLSQRTLVLQYQQGGKTAARIRFAEELGCEVAYFDKPANDKQRSSIGLTNQAAKHAADAENRRWEEAPEGDGFIACL